eukprot:1124944-Prymnesium_polylepis.1
MARTVLGDASAIASSILTAASFVCHRCSSNCSNSSCKTPSTATGLRAPISAEPARSAACRTGRCLSAQSDMIAEKSVKMYGSTQ